MENIKHFATREHQWGTTRLYTINPQTPPSQGGTYPTCSSLKESLKSIRPGDQPQKTTRCYQK